MIIILLLLLTAGSASSADTQGHGSNPFVTKELDEITTLSFFTKPDDDNLYFRLSWKESKTSTSSISSGTGVPPSQKYAYYWDDSAKTFWFADARFLQLYDLSDAKQGSTESVNSSTSDFRSQAKLPKDMVSMIEALLQK